MSFLTSTRSRTARSIARYDWPLYHITSEELKTRPIEFLLHCEITHPSVVQQRNGLSSAWKIILFLWVKFP